VALQWTEMIMVRWMCGIKLHDREFQIKGCERD